MKKEIFLVSAATQHVNDYQTKNRFTLEILMIQAKKAKMIYRKFFKCKKNTAKNLFSVLN